MKPILFTDWEGPWVLTDFAFELASIYMNSRFYSNLSSYDDHLAYTVGKPGYEAGYTVKLLVPFLKAAGVRNEDLKRLAGQLASFVPDSKKAMDHVQKVFTPVVISTSYIQFLEVTAEMLGVEGYLHGTEVDLDSINVGEDEREYIKGKIDEFSSLKGEELFDLLDEFYEVEFIRRIVDSVKAVGAGEKARILRKYCEECDVAEPIAVGDSISDYKMFDAALELGGHAVAFNGNAYAIEHASIAIVSESAMAEAVVVTTLHERGLKAVKELRLPKTEIFIIEESDFEEVVEKSSRMRVKLRGCAGSLG